MQEYRGRPQLVGSHSVSWLVIRKKKVVREAFQKGLPIDSGGRGGGGSGSVGDDDADPFEDSPPSGPDAGGGQTDSVLSAAVWEVQASSNSYTMSQVDHDRCGCFSHVRVGEGGAAALNSDGVWLRTAVYPWQNPRVYRQPVCIA